MQRPRLVASIALTLCFVAWTATAGGVNLAWSNCFGEGTGTSNRAFGCDTNAGTNVLVVSFIPSAEAAEVSGNEVVIDVLSAVDPLPLWWQMKDPGTCRQTSLGFNSTANAGDVVCVDWAAGQSSGGIGAYSMELGAVDPSLTTRHRRLKIAVAVPLAGLSDMQAGTEYFSCNVTVNNLKTVGTGACTGCNEPLCIVLNSLKITTRTGAGDVHLKTPATPGSNIVIWQGVGPNCLLVPTRNATWGAVKALFR